MCSATIACAWGFLCAEAAIPPSFGIHLGVIWRRWDVSGQLISRTSYPYLVQVIFSLGRISQIMGDALASAFRLDRA